MWQIFDSEVTAGCCYAPLNERHRVPMTTKSLAAVVAVCAAILSSATLAQAPSGTAPTAFRIDAPSMSQALLQFTQQSGLQLAFSSDEPLRLKAPRVEGTLTPRAALDELLKGTGLEYEFVNERTISIRKSVPTGTASEKTSMNRPGTVAHLAQAGRDRSAADVGNGVSGGAQSRDLEDEGVKGIEQVVVTGSRLSRPAGDVGPAPVTVFDRDRIDGLGVSNVADVLSYLPQQAFSFAEAVGQGGAKTVQLHGLGFGSTLVLINGRRATVSAATNSSNYFDLNTIPLSAVERVDVLSGSASAVYGADAVGGVINILLKRDVEKPAVDLYYGTADGGAAERRVSASIGKVEGRYRGTLVLDYFDRETLLGSEREPLASQDYRNFGSPDRRVTTANPANICAATGNLPGLSSRCAAVPAGSSGVGLTPASFVATDGSQNLDSLRSYSSAVPDAERFSITALGDIDVATNFSIFAEFMYTGSETQTFSSPSALTNRLVPAANPFNPFGVPVLANYLFTGIETRYAFTESDSYRGVLGAKGALGRWNWELSALGFRDKARSDNTRNGVDLARVDAALASTNPATALNVFQDGPGGSEELLSSLIADPVLSRVVATSDARQVNGFLNGGLFDLPAGAVQAVIGAEFRTEKISSRIPAAGTDFLAGSSSRDTYAGFAEIALPIISGDMQVPMVEQLGLTLAGRYDHYDDFGSSYNGQYGLEWRPVSVLLLRASYGTSFRAPALFDLSRAPSQGTGTSLDPRRNETATYVTQLGGNPDLRPEEAQSLSYGFVFEPRLLGGARISGTYWRIDQDERTNVLQPIAILNNEALFPERVVRDAPTAADLSAGLPGRLLRIDSTTVNFGRLKTSGIDLDAYITIRTAYGRFTPSVAATWVESFETADFPNSPPTERVGIANFNGSIPRWRSTAQLQWSLGGVSLSATGRYISAYSDTANFTNLQNGLSVGDQTVFDLQARLDLGVIVGSGSSWSRGLIASAGAKNLFDNETSFSDVQGRGYDPSQGELRQRFIYATLSKAF